MNANYRAFAAAVRLQLLRWMTGSSATGHPRRLLRVWPLWERIARTMWPVVDIPGSRYGLVGLHFTRYRGVPFTLPDGTLIGEGDPVAEIHFDNRVAVQTMGNRRGSNKWYVVILLRDSLRALANWINQPDFPHEIKAIFGISVLSRGAVRVGFIIRPRKSGLRNRLDRIYFDGLLALYSAEGLERLALGRTAQGNPTEMWMSVTELLRRHGASHSPPDAAV